MPSKTEEIVEELVAAVPVEAGANSRKGQFRENVRGQLRGALFVALGDPMPGTEFPKDGYDVVKETVMAFGKSTRFDPIHRESAIAQLQPVLNSLDELASNNFEVGNRQRGIVGKLNRLFSKS